MKKYILVIFICASWAFVFSEISEGVVTYTTKINMHKRIPPGQDQVKQLIPEFSTNKTQLIFSGDESLSKPVPEDVNPFDQGPGGGTRMIRMVVGSETYMNRDADMVTQLREFMGKNYIIKKDIQRIPWKLANETKEILGYSCKKAFYVDDNQREITAWYTEAIRLPIGPENYHGLPGLILQVEVNKDEIVITADKIDIRSLKKNELKEPKGGQEISEEGYRAMVEEQMKKMGAQSGPGGMRMVIRN